MIQQISIPVTHYEIAADWHQGSDDRSVLLVIVGLGSTKKNNSAFIAEIVAATGSSALVLDLSGHGESPFATDETMPAQHVLEATKAYDWITENYSTLAIDVMGTSNGGFIAAYLTRFRAVRKLILRTPAIYEPKDFYSIHKYIDKQLVRDYRKKSELVRRHPLFLQKPLADSKALVMVHTEDTSIPTETSDIYIAEFAAKKYVAEGFVHSFRDPSNPVAGIAPYMRAIVDWLANK